MIFGLLGAAATAAARPPFGPWEDHVAARRTRVERIIRISIRKRARFPSDGSSSELALQLGDPLLEAGDLGLELEQLRAERDAVQRLLHGGHPLLESLDGGAQCLILASKRSKRLS